MSRRKRICAGLACAMATLLALVVASAAAGEKGRGIGHLAGMIYFATAVVSFPVSLMGIVREWKERSDAFPWVLAVLFLVVVPIMVMIAIGY